MNVTIDNTANSARRGWVSITTPTPLARDLPAECEVVLDDRPNVRLRAVKRKALDFKTVFDVYVPHLAGKNRLSGTLRQKLTEEQSPPFALHKWVADDLKALVPVLNVAFPVGSVSSELDGPTSIALVESTPTMQRYRIEQVVRDLGLRFTVFADVMSGSATIAYRARIVWSSRVDPSVTRRFEGFVLECGELMTVRFGARRGVQDPYRSGAKWYLPLTSGPVVFTDGMALAFAGEIRACDSSQTPVHPDAWTIEDRLEFESHQADGYLSGVCHDWNGHFCAFGHTPKLTAQAMIQATQQDAAEFQHPSVRGWFGPRAYGLTASPGQAGAQDDFGAVKGTIAVSGPIFFSAAIFLMEEAVFADMLRGYHHFETSGAMVTAGGHPNWATWGGVTHYHPAVSPDRLGKGSAPVFPAGAWFGVDDEHASRNVFAAYLTLTDDPMAEEAVVFLTETERSTYRLRFPQNGAGAARAQGRTLGALAQLAWTSSPAVRDRLFGVITARVENSQRTFPPSTLVFRPLAVGGPDPRKDVFNEDGTRASWVSVWEHALAFIGLLQCQRVAARCGRTVPGLDDLVTATANLIVTFGFFRGVDPRTGSQTWWIVDDMRAAPDVVLAPDSRDIVANAGLRGVGNWTFAALLAARSMLGDHPRKNELAALISFVTNNDTAQDRYTAEWWAAAGL
jgi:hypothetical protein